MIFVTKFDAAVIFPTPVIAITALAMPGDRERCLEAGADEYISKPIRLKDLAALIQEMLMKKLKPGNFTSSLDE